MLFAWFLLSCVVSRSKPARQKSEESLCWSSLRTANICASSGPAWLQVAWVDIWHLRYLGFLARGRAFVVAHPTAVEVSIFHPHGPGITLPSLPSSDNIIVRVPLSRHATPFSRNCWILRCFDTADCICVVSRRMITRGLFRSQPHLATTAPLQIRTLGQATVRLRRRSDTLHKYSASCRDARLSHTDSLAYSMFLRDTDRQMDPQPASRPARQACRQTYGH